MAAFARFLFVLIGALVLIGFLLAVSGHGAAALALGLIAFGLAVIARRADRIDR